MADPTSSPLPPPGNSRERQPSISELLQRWEELRRQGKDASPEELCRECPELAPELARRLAALGAVHGVMEPTTSGPADAQARTAALPGAAASSGARATPGPGDEVGVEGQAPLPGWEPVAGYRLVQRLGKGGFGEVWKAAGPGGIDVAMKFVVLDHPTGEAEWRALQLIKNIRHTNLLALFGAWKIDRLLVIAMELADRTLRARLDEVLEQGQPGIPRRELLRYARDAAGVLDYLNKPRHFLGGKRPVGIQHCDIKPQNMLLLGDGVKVGDFGLAHVLGGYLSLGHGRMTPAYAAPECFQGKVSRHSDQYSLAVTYCQLRGGQLPFAARSYSEFERAHRQDAADLTMLPEEERQAVARALAKQPQGRWPNCRSFIKALADSRPGGRGDDAGPPPPAPPGPVAAGEIEQPERAGTAGLQAGPPQRVGEGYQLLRRLGSGGLGEVWHAHAPGNLDVAIKITPQPHDHDEAQRLLTALENIKRLRHPGLLQTHAFWTKDDRLYVVMELAACALGDRLRQCRAAGLSGIPDQELFHYISDAAEALDYLHEQQVIHRDIRPENLLILQGHAKVADFGLVRRMQSQHLASATSSGTPAYMAPEVWRGKISVHSDQYSLAATYAEMRLGRRLYQADTMVDLMLMHLEGGPDLVPLPPAEQAVVRKALSKDPERRYASCGEFARQLGTVIELGGSLTAPPTSAPGEGPSETPTGNILRAERWETLARRPSPRAENRTEALPTSALERASEPGWRTEPARPRSAPARKGTGGRRSRIVILLLLLTLIILAVWYSYPVRTLGDSASWVPPVAGAAAVLAVITVWWLLGRASSRDRAERPRKGAAGPPTPPPRPVTAEETVYSTRRGAPPLAAAPVTAPSAHAEWVPRVGSLEGHEDSVWAVSFSPDGRHLLSGSMDQTARLWDTGTGHESRRFQGHTEGIASVAFARSGRRVLTGSLDDSVRWWDVDTGNELRRLSGHADSVLSVGLSPDERLALSGSADGSIRLWDIDAGTEVRRFEGHDGWVHAVAFAPDGRSVLSGGEDGTVRLWDVDTGRELDRFTGHEGPVRAVAFAPDGRSVLSGGTDGRVRLWNVAGRHELRAFAGHTDWVRGVAFTPDGRRIVSGSDDETVRLWDTSSGELLHTFEGHTWSVLAVAVSTDGRRAVSGSDDATLRFWQLDTVAPTGGGLMRPAAAAAATASREGGPS
jgi:serine/threonine protein kinase